MKNLFSDVLSGFGVTLVVLAVAVASAQGCASSVGDGPWCYPNPRSEQQCFETHAECQAAAARELTYRPQCHAAPAVETDGGHE